MCRRRLCLTIPVLGGSQSSLLTVTSFSCPGSPRISLSGGGRGENGHARNTACDTSWCAFDEDQAVEYLEKLYTSKPQDVNVCNSTTRLWNVQGFLAMLFRASSGFNHSCFPNAGAYTPGWENMKVAEASAATVKALRTFAIEDIFAEQEVCISYLGDSTLLSTTSTRQEALTSWGFTCQCTRCKGGRPLDSRLQGFSFDDHGSQVEHRLRVQAANSDYRSLFDRTYEEYNPPLDDFEANSVSCGVPS